MTLPVLRKLSGRHNLHIYFDQNFFCLDHVEALRYAFHTAAVPREQLPDACPALLLHRGTFRHTANAFL